MLLIVYVIGWNNVSDIVVNLYVLGWSSVFIFIFFPIAAL